jgi:hypothetical protein
MWWGKKLHGQTRHNLKSWNVTRVRAQGVYQLWNYSQQESDLHSTWSCQDWEKVPLIVPVTNIEHTCSSLGMNTLIGRSDRPTTSWSNASGLSSHICQFRKEPIQHPWLISLDPQFGESQPLTSSSSLLCYYPSQFLRGLLVGSSTTNQLVREISSWPNM